MVKYSFNEEVQEYEKTNPQTYSSDWFKFKEGQNKIRVLSQGKVLSEHFKLGVCYGMEKGCPFHTSEYEKSPARPKWLMWIIDRADNKIKLAKMPYKIVKAIADLQTNEDYSFDEIPMPYDITITATKAGTKEVEYSTVPSIKRIEITPEEDEEYNKQTSVEDIVQKMKDKQQKIIELNPEFQNQRSLLKEELEKTSDEPVDSNYPEEEALEADQIPW